VTSLTKPKGFKKTVLFLAKKLSGHRYAFRGTTSLVLQNLAMSIDDIDILTDKKTALTTNEILKKYLIEKVAFKTSPQFKSYFGQFKVNNILVEIMGDWQIKGAKGGWSQPFTAAPREIKTITFNRQKVVVTTPEAELSFFALMGRWNAYHKIKRQLAQKDQVKLF